MCNCKGLLVRLENGAGELVVSCREADSDEAARNVAIEMIESVPFLAEGDVIRVVRS